MGVAAGIKIQPQSSARSSSSITPPSNQHSPRNDEYLMMRSSQPSRYGGTQVLPPLGGLSLKQSTAAAAGDPLKQTPTLEPLREERSSPVTAREQSNTNRFYASSHGRSSKYPSHQMRAASGSNIGNDIHLTPVRGGTQPTRHSTTDLLSQSLNAGSVTGGSGGKFPLMSGLSRLGKMASSHEDLIAPFRGTPKEEKRQKEKMKDEEREREKKRK